MSGPVEADRLSSGAPGGGPGTALFGVDSVVRRVNGEGALLIGGGRALLMQIAHPLVAQGVAEHSDFAHDRIGRLLRTLRPVYAISFGTPAQAEAAAARVRHRHEAVSGSGYRATDPELLLWVHATLIDSALLTYQRFVQPLSRRDAERYYEESGRIGELFGVPPSMLPADLEGFERYVAGTVAELAVSATARRIAQTIFTPDPLWLAPALLLAREATAGLLPPRLRDQYGLRWGSPRARLLSGLAAGSRAVLPRLPRTWRAPPRPFLPAGVTVV
ncbi:MAG: oxygenase MpaB family protein [Chloroflexi bacterium]|nr:oxygenase MpaB family protein [Chloroflexota bacterium]